MFQMIKSYWQRLSNIGVKSDFSEIEIAKNRIYNYLILTILIIQVLLLIREVITQDTTGITIISTFCLISTTFLVLHHYKGLSFSAGLYNLFYPLSMGLYLLLIGDGEGIEYSFFVFMLTAVIFQRKNITRVALIAYNILLFIGCSLYLEYYGPLLPPRAGEQSDYLILFIATSLSFAWVIYVFNLALEQYDNKSLELIHSLKKQNTKLSLTNEELERFTYIASHDLKTPLRNIVSFLGLMDKRIQEGQTDDLEEYFSIVKSNARDMYTLIEETLEYSKIGQNDWKVEAINLNEIVDKVKEQLVLNNSDGIQVDSDQLPTIKGDRFYLFKLFFNLIENGIKYNDRAVKQIKIKVKKVLENNIISIEDNGIGIEKRYHDQIFTMFKRLHTSEEFEGTGIGLSMCKKIIEKLNGKIWLESTPEKGSTFFLMLPGEVKIPSETLQEQKQPD